MERVGKTNVCDYGFFAYMIQYSYYPRNIILESNHVPIIQVLALLLYQAGIDQSITFLQQNLENFQGSKIQRA